MQLSFDGADRLVELVEARRGPVPASEAARSLFALASAPTAIARALLDDVVSGDARLAWRGAAVGLADPPGAALLLEHASFVVFDLETTGLSPARSRIVEIGAQRVDALEAGDTFETLVNPGVPLPTAITALTGIAQGDVRGAPSADLAVRRFLSFEAVADAYSEPLRERAELRYKLTGAHTAADANGRSASPTVRSGYEEAHAAVTATPCDVSVARYLVDQYLYLTRDLPTAA